ncbi:cell wall-binding repeat-containing protein [Clostridium sp. Marseille-Q2269]|uniref:cell wall-binding repeat-containing protein n=1 Tax=Clostridium sp. Marseille-Q2269 TaxID=2942205 RepID=UPI00207471C7|nr:cell wall-binding repeat-containing protein [Clostridium sp. Marseille-Q2269]
MNNKGRKALASATVVGLFLSTIVAGTVKAAPGDVNRIQGNDRYETAANVAKANWKGEADNVIIASGNGYADSLSASVLAKKLNAPIILTTASELNSNSKSALETLKPKNVYVIGGNASVSHVVRDGLKKQYKVIELGGKTRFETNIAIANHLVDKLGVKAENVMVINGNDGFSDALSVAPVAAAKEQILLIIGKDGSTADLAANFIKKHNSKVTVIGTEGVVPTTVYNKLGATERVKGGATRFETNINIMKRFKLNADKIYVANATGNGYADALVASAIAGKTGSVLILTDRPGTNGTKNAVNYIKENKTDKTEVQALGGNFVIPEEIFNEIKDVIKPHNEEKPNESEKGEKHNNTVAKGKIVNIHDVKLKEVLNHALGQYRKPNDEITKEEMESLKELSSDYLSIIDKTGQGSRGISDLTGLEYAINLEKLDLSENKISDLSPLRNSTKIKWLELDRNYITDLSPLSKMTALEHLNIYNNEDIVDLNPISKLTTIKWIDMHHCSRSEAPLNVEVLKNLTNLEYLSFETNKITDLSFAKSLPNLKTLSCNNTFVTDLAPVQDLAIYAFNDWSGERFFNMFGQKLNTLFNIKTNANGGEYRFKSPVKNYERYKAHIEKTLKESGEEAKVPAVDANNVNVDYLHFDFDHTTNEVVVKVDPNKTNKPRKYKVEVLLEYGMYSLRENFQIVQDAKKSISNLDEEPIKMSESTRNFYLDLFNKYNKYDKKYTNVVDDMASSYKALPNDHIFTIGDMKKLKKFYDSEYALTPELVAPLNYATNLENFEVLLDDKNLVRNVENFDFLKNCKKLKVLYYMNNGLTYAKDEKSQIKDITAIASLTNLQDLRINMTTLEDVTPISNLKLKYLVLPDNCIKEVNSTIGKITTLERLDIENNQVSDISEFKNLVNLRSSYLYNNKLTDIGSLSQLHKLEALLINNNNIKDITPLKNLSLKRLYANGNPLPSNYMDIVKKFLKVNTLKVGDISIDDFKWMKAFALRSEDELSDLDENNARLYTFINMPIEIKVSSKSIKDGVLTIDNPLTGLNDEPVLQDEYNNEGKINNNITFKSDKIEIKMDDPSVASLEIKYPIYTENSAIVFGHNNFLQSPSIEGTVVLNIKIEK